MFSASESTQASTEIARSIPAALQHLVVGRPARAGTAHPSGRRCSLVLVELVDDDEVVAAGLQVAGDLAADAAEAADQVVVVESASIFFRVRRSSRSSPRCPATKNSVTVTRA